MFDFYATESGKGFPGMKADTVNDDVFSFAAETGVNPGEPVIRGTDPDKQVKPASTAGDAAKVVGVAVHTHKEPNEGGKYYEPGYCLPVMEKGDVYVQAGGDVTAGDGAGLIFGADGALWLGASDSISAATAGSNTYQVVTNAAASDTVVFGGVTLTGGASTDGFVVGADAAATASNLATAFGANSVVGGTYTFTANNDEITITESTAGGGDTPGSMTTTGTVSIVGGTATTSTVTTTAAESIPGVSYLESGSEGDIVAIRILK